MNSVDINFSEFGPPIKLIIIDPKKYKSRFKSSSTVGPVPVPARSAKLGASSVSVNTKSGGGAGQNHPQITISNYNHHRDYGQIVHIPGPRINGLGSGPPPWIPLQVPNNADKDADYQLSPQPQPSKSKAAPRVSNSSLSSDEVEDEQIQSYLASEQTTRVGRVSKKPKLYTTEERAGGPNAEPGSPKPKVRKRVPADVFRCKTCFKYYVGHSKLRLHYKKNPDHKIPSPQKLMMSIPPASPPEIVILKSCTSVGVQANIRNTSTSLSEDSNSSESDATMFDSISLESSSSLKKHPRRRILGPITVPLTSGNVMSPGENSMNAMTLSNDEFEFTDYQANTSNQEQDSLISGSGAFNKVSLHLRPIEVNVDCQSMPQSGTGSGSGSPILPESDSPSAVSPNCTAPNENDSLDQQMNCDLTDHNDAINQPRAERPADSKLVWQFIEEKLIREGINQILVEISDVAEKLSKIARDKIIPIREEEEERLASSVPIIQVDNPFLSHLLDLPFGTYIFKEDDDEDLRRIKPQSATELSQLSLTGGAEVDIDKFLSPDLVLPHLTNLDFNAICNNNSNHAH